MQINFNNNLSILINMNILNVIGIPYFKDGSGIHIKEKNKGKFTQAAKQHGMGVQEFASHVLSNKDKLINYSENPDSIGWDAKTRRWYAPPKNKGYDTNQFGMGVDRNQTPGFDAKVKKDKQGREYLTAEDERYLRFLAIDRANKSANDRYAYAQKATGTKGSVSPKHDAITVSAIYNLGPGHVARTLFENMNTMKALFNRNSDDYQKSVHKQYKKKDRNERIDRELQFFKKRNL